MQDPINGEHLFEELTQNMTESQKSIISQIVQGQNIFTKYTISDALSELDDLFDSK